MSKYLVTGLLSRGANPAKNKRDVMVSWLLAETLREMGHEVEHRNPTVFEDYDDFDHVFLGLAALHSIGANRAYGWTAAYIKNVPRGKCTLFIDDVDTAKVLSGIRVMYNDEPRFFKPYYNYRLEYDKVVDSPEWREWLMQGVTMLHDNAWPRVIVPMFPWGDADQFRRRLPNATEIVPVDFSGYVPHYVGEDEWSPEPKREWITEMKHDDKWYERVRPIFPVRTFGKGYEKRPEDAGLSDAYAKSWGVIEKGLEHGFFHSRLVYAAHARTLFITNWQNARALGEPYALLADAAAEFTEEQRIEWAVAQQMSYVQNTWSREQTKDALFSLINEKVDA